MKKYIIKNSDGSEQNVMQAVHFSRKDAGETLKEYLFKNKEDLNDDDYLLPFDFILEEVECKDVNEVITDFKSARKALGLETDDGFRAASWLTGEDALSISKVSHFVDEINPKNIEALIALNKLMTISEAWNKEDGFVPDFSDCEQDKWIPWFEYDNDAVGFVYAHVHYMPTDASMNVGFCICFKSSVRAAQFGRQFADLYNKVFL